MILNTKTKTITPEGETFGEIYQELQKMRPDDWAQFMIEPQTITVEKWDTFPIYPNPIYPDTTPWNPNPYEPPYGPIVTWCGDTITHSDILCMAFASTPEQLKSCLNTSN